VVVAEHTAPIKGKFLEVLGFLNPHTKEKSLNDERIKYWLEKGAQPSDSVHNLLVANGIVKGPKRAVKIKAGKKEKTKETGGEKPAEEKSAKTAEKEEKKPAEVVKAEEEKEAEAEKPEPKEKEAEKKE